MNSDFDTRATSLNQRDTTRSVRSILLNVLSLINGVTRRRRNGWQKISQWLALGLAIALSLIVWSSMAIAQDQIETAPIVLDGQQLFEVTSFESNSASERAEWINYLLASFAESDAPISVAVEQRGQTHSIIVNNRHLLSVTQQDAELSGLVGMTPQRQARLWAQEIEAALEQSRRERTVQYRNRAIAFSLGTIAVVGLAHWGLGRLKRRFMGEIEHSTSPDSFPPLRSSRALNLLLDLILVLLRIGIWIGAVLYIMNLFPVSRTWSYTVARRLRDSFVSPAIPIGDNVYSITQLFVLIGLIFGLIIAAGLVTNLLRSRILQMAGISSGAQAVIAALTRYTLIAVGLVVLLQIWGLDLSSLTLLASALGVGIGFGLQDIARDFGSGLVLLFERPVQVGDFIEVGEFMGTVDRIGARSTNIKTLSQVSVIVPNSYFLENQVINWSHDNPLSRISIPVGVSYKSDPEAVRKILLEAGRSHQHVVATPIPQVFFKGFGDSSIDFELLVWIVEPNLQPIIKSDLYFEIFKLLAQHHIEIPFPQRDLHVRSGNLPVELINGSHPYKNGQFDAQGRIDEPE
ncbi:MAG: mechanosensitive ion channel family protein [Elainellaceae cyanobacterium]